MVNNRSFTEFVKDKCYNDLFLCGRRFYQTRLDELNLWTHHVHQIGKTELADIYIQRVYVRNLPEMRIAFDVAVQLELVVGEGDYHYDETDVCNPWLRMSCEGDLSCGLDDWKINSVFPYSSEPKQSNALSDALVPIIHHDQLENIVDEFLNKYYPEALKVIPRGEESAWVDPKILSKRLGLNVELRRIRKDASIFG